MVIQNAKQQNAKLVLTLEGIMHAYGDTPNHRHAMTRREPTKSAVVGLIVQGCGWDFADDELVKRLAALNMLVRCDIEGEMKEDFQIVRNAASADGLAKSVKTLPTTRWYLTCASFVVVLTGDKDLLTEVHERIRFPRRLMWLGRKNCVPSRPVWNKDGLVTTDETARQILERWPWNPGALGGRKRPRMLRLVIDHGIAGETSDLTSEVRHDHPLSLNPDRRRYCDRTISFDYLRSDNLPVQQRRR